MDGIGPEHIRFIFDEVGSTAEAIDDTADTMQTEDCCTVPGCGHWESAHERNHCRTCHTVGEAARKGSGFKPGACLHYYYPPRTED